MKKKELELLEMEINIQDSKLEYYSVKKMASKIIENRSTSQN